MIIHKQYDIQGHDDFELNIKRESKLTYHFAYNQEVTPKGIIFVIPGFGDDNNIDYQKNLLQHIAQAYNFLAVYVEYHACFNRVNETKNSAKLNFGAIDIELLLQILKNYNITLNEKYLDFSSILYQVNSALSKLKETEQLNQDFLLDIWATFFPAKNEYQNFGVLQAVDILTVLCHLKSIGYHTLIEHAPVIALGSSHGSYIANLLMKFAPSTFDVIIDNSCYIKPALNYIIGLEDNPKVTEYSFKISNYPHINLNVFTHTHWTTNQQSSYNFTKSAYEIRDLSNSNQHNQRLCRR
jgi:hypothetical protein